MKSNKPVWFGSANGGALTETPDHNLYRPMDAATFWTRARRAVVARCIVYSFLTYFMPGEVNPLPTQPLRDMILTTTPL